MKKGRIFRSFASLSLISLIAGSAAFPFTHEEVQAPTGAFEAPIDFHSDAGSFTGAFKVKSFVVNEDKILAKGELKGEILNAAGEEVGTINREIAPEVIIERSFGTCENLHFELDGIREELPGLKLEVENVRFDLSGHWARGRQFGSLLCTVGSLLRKRNSLNGIAGLSNNIIRYN